MALAERVRARGSDHELELARYLWEEYKYRHDLIWRLLFRVTAVAALLSIAPFTISDTAGQRAELPGEVPARARDRTRTRELDSAHSGASPFKPIDRHYVRAQDSVVGEPVRKAEKLEHKFEWVVAFTRVCCCILTITVGCIVWFRHTPS